MLEKSKHTIEELVKMDPDDIIHIVRKLDTKCLNKLLRGTLDFVESYREMSPIEYFKINVVMHRIFQRDPSEQLRETLSELAERAMQYLNRTLNERPDPDVQHSALRTASSILRSNPFLRYETAETTRRLLGMKMTKSLFDLLVFHRKKELRSRNIDAGDVESLVSIVAKKEPCQVLTRPDSFYGDDFGKSIYCFSLSDSKLYEAELKDKRELDRLRSDNRIKVVDVDFYGTSIGYFIQFISRKEYDRENETDPIALNNWLDTVKSLEGVLTYSRASLACVGLEKLEEFENNSDEWVKKELFNKKTIFDFITGPFHLLFVARCGTNTAVEDVLSKLPQDVEKFNISALQHYTRLTSIYSGDC